MANYFTDGLRRVWSDITTADFWRGYADTITRTNEQIADETERRVDQMQDVASGAKNTVDAVASVGNWLPVLIACLVAVVVIRVFKFVFS